MYLFGAGASIFLGSPPPRKMLDASLEEVENEHKLKNPVIGITVKNTRYKVT